MATPTIRLNNRISLSEWLINSRTPHRILGIHRDSVLSQSNVNRLLYIKGWMCDVLLPSHNSLHHRVDVGCLTSQSPFSTSQGGCGMSYFPVTILYITGWRHNVLLPSHHSLLHRVEARGLTAESSFSTSQGGCGVSYYKVTILYITGKMWDVLLPSHHSLHHRVDVGCLTLRSTFKTSLTSLTSFSTSQAGCGMSYCPVIILYITRWTWDVLLP